MEPPDRLEKGIRFGCGFLLGVATAIGALLTTLWRLQSVVAACVLVGLLCGYFAMRFGDRFWDFVLRWWPWI